MIKIEKRIIEVNNEQFIKILKEMANVYKPLGYIGFTHKMLNTEFKLKLTLFDFAALCEGLGFKLTRGCLMFEVLFGVNNV